MTTRLSNATHLCLLPRCCVLLLPCCRLGLLPGPPGSKGQNLQAAAHIELNCCTVCKLPC